eukprot:12794885-Alexandrium_andersonii.AAC.1
MVGAASARPTAAQARQGLADFVAAGGWCPEPRPRPLPESRRAAPFGKLARVASRLPLDYLRPQCQAFRTRGLGRCWTRQLNEAAVTRQLSPAIPSNYVRRLMPA